LNAPLPFVEGVGPSCQWLPAGPRKTVIDFFKEQYPHVDATTWNARMAKVGFEERAVMTVQMIIRRAARLAQRFNTLS